jgi:hypothetical protein
MRGCLLALVALVLTAPLASAQEVAVSESSVKSAFVYNFLKFINLPHVDDHISLCVVGTGERLESFRAVDGKIVEGRPIRVQVVATVASLASCDVLFLSEAKPALLKSWMEESRTLGLLDIGEQSEFIALGGVINFYVEEGKVRFEISLDAAEDRGIKISSKLLKLGKVVDGQGNRAS